MVAAEEKRLGVGSREFMERHGEIMGLTGNERKLRFTGEHTPKEMERLMHLAEKNGISVKFTPFKGSDGRLAYAHGEVRIGIRIGMSFDEYVYNLAHELAHYFLHYDKGDTIRYEKHEEYEEQADRAAKMLLAALSTV